MNMTTAITPGWRGFDGGGGGLASRSGAAPVGRTSVLDAPFRLSFPSRELGNGSPTMSCVPVGRSEGRPGRSRRERRDVKGSDTVDESVNTKEDTEIVSVSEVESLRVLESFGRGVDCTALFEVGSGDFVVVGTVVSSGLCDGSGSVSVWVASPGLSWAATTSSRTTTSRTRRSTRNTNLIECRGRGEARRSQRALLYLLFGKHIEHSIAMCSQCAAIPRRCRRRRRRQRRPWDSSNRFAWALISLLPSQRPANKSPSPPPTTLASFQVFRFALYR